MRVGKKNGRGVDRAGDLHEIEREEGINVGGGEEAFVAVAVETAVGVVVAGRVVAAAAAAAVVGFVSVAVAIAAAVAEGGDDGVDDVDGVV